MDKQDSVDDRGGSQERLPEEPHLAKVKAEIEKLCVADTDEENIALKSQLIP